MAFIMRCMHCCAIVFGSSYSSIRLIARVPCCRSWQISESSRRSLAMKKHHSGRWKTAGVAGVLGVP